MRLIPAGDQPAFVMLSRAKHLANDGNLRFFSYGARSFANAQDGKNEGSASQNVAAHGASGGAEALAFWSRGR